MPSVIVCPACDLAHRRTEECVTERTRCARCRAPLQRPENAAIDTAIALTVCALVFLVLSNLYPLVAMYVNGHSRDTTLIGAALGLYAQGYDSLGTLVFLTTVVALWRGRRARGQIAGFRLLARLRPWSFMEVFMLGALAALVRLANFAHIVPGVSLWSCGLLMLCLSALTNITSPEQLWRWVERSQA
jgi:paraquat-inducible protein A